MSEPLLPSTSTRTRTRASSFDDNLNNTNDNNSNNDNHVGEDDHLLRRRGARTGRILDRDADFFQSRGRWKGVQLLPRASGQRNRLSLSATTTSSANNSHPSRRNNGNCCHCWKRLIRRWFPRWWDDWFHTLAYQRTILLMIVLFLMYASIVVGFGVLYFAVSVLGSKRTYQDDGSFVTESFCGMDINDHMEALYFSLSTMATIGYGVSDYYFGGCWTPFLMVLMQVCTAITFDACAVGLLFTRLSRGRKRSKTVIVSNQAIVQRVQGIPYFMIRVGELRRFPLIHASVRLYCIRHERIPKWYHIGDYQQHNGGRSNNDTQIANTGNTESPYSMPPLEDKLTNRATTTTTRLPGGSGQPPCYSPTTDSTVPVDTTHFVTRPMKLLHTNGGVNQSTDYSSYILMSLPQVIVHRMDDHTHSPLIPPPEWYDKRGRLHRYPANPDNLLDTQAQIHDFWRDRNLEIVVLVEGVDELTGATIQTRHSYSATSDEEDGDVVWNRAFVNCVLPYHNVDNAFDEEDEESTNAATIVDGEPICTVDFSNFHDTHPVPRDCLASPYVPF